MIFLSKIPHTYILFVCGIILSVLTHTVGSFFVDYASIMTYCYYQFLLYT